MDAFPTKDPQEKLDYQFDFSPWLGADTISGSPTVTVTGATLSTPSPSSAAGIVTFWLTGGTAGTTAIVTCTVNTAAGRTIERSASLYIDDL